MSDREHGFVQVSCRMSSMDINSQELWLISGLANGPAPPWSGVISGDWSNNWLPIDEVIE